MRTLLLVIVCFLSFVDSAGASSGGVVPGTTGPAAERAAGDAAVRFRALMKARIARAADLHDAWGTFFDDTASTGLQATHTVLDVTTTGGDYVYAPTALPPGDACLELTTAYTPSGPKLWAWDWCGGRDSIGKIVDMDAAFQATYTTVVDGRRVYTMDEHRTSTTANTWTAYLRNYRTGAWDVFFTSTGAKDIPGSTWDFFEIYTTVNPATGAGYYCRNLAGKAIEATDVKVQQGGAWVPASPANSSLAPPVPGSRFDCPSLTFSVTHANDAWRAQVGGQGQPGTSYEAESGTLGGQAAVRGSPGASGGALVGYVGGGAANYLQFAVNATAGAHPVTIHYASGEARSLTASVNGGATVSVTTPGTGGWDTVGSVSVTLNLTAGANTIRLGNPAGWAPDIDRIVVG